MKFRRFVAALGFAAAVIQVAPAQAYTFGPFVTAMKSQEAAVVSSVEPRAEAARQVRQLPAVSNGIESRHDLRQATKLRAISTALMFR